MKYSSDACIAVVCGGPSAEAEVSRVSGRCVAEALKGTYANVVLLELDRDIAKALESNAVDVVFPALHGPPGEDGTFQGFLETLGYPYVGSGVLSSAYAMDKSVAKHIFRQAELPVAKDMTISSPADPREVSQRVVEFLGQEVVVKPSRQGSAVGVAFGNNREEIEKILPDALSYDGHVLVEERVRGREVTVGILERDKPEPFPAIEVRTPAGTWYDYEHRYTAGASEHVVPAPLPERQFRQVQEIAVLAHQALGCRDLSRADFIVPGKGEPIILEVNTLPGMTPTSLYPDGARAAGLSFEGLVALFVERTLRRARG